MRIRLWHWLDLLTTALALGAALLAIAAVAAQPRGQNRRGNVPPAVLDTPGLETSLPTHVLGTIAATVVITEFIDFECYFCGEYARKTYPRVEEAFVATGRVRYAFRHYPIAVHRSAADAARATECAGEDNRFWLMRQQLFASDAGLQLSSLRRHAKTISLSLSQFESCMHEPDSAAKIDKDIAEARRLGVDSTPTFLIGRLQGNTTAVLLEKRIVGAQPFEVFRTVLDEMLVGAGR